MKAVSAYTYEDDRGENRSLMVVTDSGEHVPFPLGATVYKGESLSSCITADDEWINSCTNIQPVELPEAKS